MVKGDVGDIIVGAALPRVVEPEAKGAGVPSVQCRVFPKCTVLYIDRPIVDLHASDWKITAQTQMHKRRH